MDTQHVIDQLPDYLSGSLSESSKTAIEAHLKTCLPCKSEFETVRALWNELSLLPEERPSEAVRANFYSKLNEYVAQQKSGQAKVHWGARLNELLERVWPKQPAFQLTIAVVFLFVGYVIGFRVDGMKDNGRDEVAQLRGEVQTMQRLVTLSLLKVESASERMKGVSWSEQMRQPDTEVMDALMQALNYDPNVNVRLAAMDALIKFSDQAEVKHALVQSLPKQTSPLIQLALVDVIMETKNPEAAGTFKQMLEQQNLNQTVKERIKERLVDLSQ